MFLQQLQQSFANYGGRNAFYIQEQFYTYARLSEKANGIAQFLSVSNTASRPVGIVVFDEFDTYAAICGIMLSGAAYVPILPSNPIDRNRSIIKQSGIEIILTPHPKTDLAAILDINDKTIETADIPATDKAFQSPEISPSDNAYILFTSGSTGVPKGVPITFGNLDTFMDSFFALGYEITENDRFLQMFDLSFDLSVMSYLAPLLRGACAYTVGHDTIKYMAIYTLLEDRKLTFTLMVPSILSYLRPYFADIELPDMRYSLFCGEALYKDITEEWKKCLPNAVVHNVYGPTEATIFCMAYDCTGEIKEHNGMVCIGQPMKNVGCLIADENNHPVPQGEKGELCLSGGQVTPGYLNNPAKNAEAFFEANGTRYYRTGDLAFADEAGDIQYAGRKDYQVKVMGGFRLELNEVEAHAREVTQLAGVVAVAKANSMGISQVYLYLEAYDGDTEEVRMHLKTQMPEYMLPEQIFSIAAFPLNANGKIDRKALVAMIS